VWKVVYHEITKEKEKGKVVNDGEFHAAWNHGREIRMRVLEKRKIYLWGEPSKVALRIWEP
jgi:hypothetical protein